MWAVPVGRRSHARRSAGRSSEAVVVALALAAGAAAPARAAEFSVSTIGDSGPGSLRQAVLGANGTPGADTITVVTTGTVSLGSSLPDLSDDVTISGPGANS